MLTVRSPWEQGHQGIIVDVECHMSNGLPGIAIVGYASKSVDEAKERIRSAFTSSKLSLPRKRIIINLAPADIPKEGASFDLAIAVAVFLAGDKDLQPPTPTTGFIGEIGLDGTIRLVRGVIGKLLAGKAAGLTEFYIPADNLEQAQLVPGVTLHPVSSLKQVYDSLRPEVAHDENEPTPSDQTEAINSIQTGEGIIGSAAHQHNATMLAVSDIIGQERAKRALVIAAAGGHNLILNGPPGTGKSMLAKALPSLLPPLSHDELVEVTHLHSLVSLNFGKIITTRPFRSPHHSASHVAIVGGGAQLRPGEITLSHRGVLFLDELPEFPRSTIESLRQPLEDHAITVARAKQTAEFPADFILVTTANPCPCGYYGTSKPCRCLPHEIQRYRRKLSGPILDRIDLYVEVYSVDHARLIDSTKRHDASSDDALRKQVRQARERQAARYARSKNKLNSGMNNRQINQHSQLSPEAKALLDTAAMRLDISARNYMRIVKVARTIADLAQSDTIQTDHISEALQYRSHNFSSADSL